ncbi:MAG: ABC transporter permease subunit [Candidatus Omnitrophica bacterium]|nr:ABC transporter permease subunit [Candidatus Omnitrophota bacterium]MCB9769523.1 ABC transporter permease subunit [Candidatus Omnitrophota bacterium]MCB9783608.1 ABC transporter permease subunit [Candidatus Omnitrophota bacterium]
MRSIWLIAKSVLIEAVRRKEIYVIVLMAVGVILMTGTVKFFGYEGMNKFYRDVSLKIMNITAALTVVVLAARQLPREFEKRTIYPLLAKPVGRSTFLAGKFLGVVLAGAFCYGLFVILFLGGMKFLGATLNWGLFAQTVFLQMLALCVVAAMAFMLSLLFNVDAAITVTVLVFALGGALSAAIDYIYDSMRTVIPFTAPWIDGHWYATSLGDVFMRFLNLAVPQLTLFDLSGKLIHENVWGPVPTWVILQLTLYAGVYLLLFLGVSQILFSRRAL